MNTRYWAVYLVRCSDNSLYCGISKNVTARIELHNSGKGAKYTRSRLPVKLVYASPYMTMSEALMLELHIKSVPAADKLETLKKLSEAIDNRRS